MYVKRIIEPGIIWYFSWRPLSLAALWSTAVFVFYHYVHLRQAMLPFLPIATVGTAVAFYVGFKNNSSYDRLWEARKIWGEITNTSRAITGSIISILRRTDAAQADMKSFIYRHLAFINMLRIQLRRRNVWDDGWEYTRMSKECFANKPFEEESVEILEKFVTADEATVLLKKKNIALEILSYQANALLKFKANDWIDPYEHSDLLRLLNDSYNHQGKAERIKTFPFPRQYAFFSEVFVYVFIVLLPFGLIGEFAKISAGHEWLTIPFTILISWVFITMEKVGDTSENPFEGSLNDVPMSTICRNIEIDLKQLLGEAELPEPLQAVDNILM